MEMSELFNDFIGEAREHISVLEAGLMDIEGGKYSADTINKIFRSVHTIKGTAAIFSLTKIVSLSHAMEDFFGTLREQTTTIPEEMIDVILQATDVLKDMIENIDASKDVIIEPLVEKIRLLNKEIVQSGSSSEYADSAESKFDAIDDLWEQLSSDFEKNDEPIEPVNLLKPIVADINSSACEPENITLPVPPAQTISTSPKSGESSSIGEETVRVSVNLLNELLDVTGEMVLFRNQLMRLIKDVGDEHSEIKLLAQNINYTTTSLQEKVMKTRMYPISMVFSKFPRIVRELSRKLNKEVDLNLQGTEVELDRSIIEGLTDPITHLIRNSMDHGIELPDERRARNKPYTGTITLHAYNESGQVNIDIIDDGNGIDIERVKQKIIEKKLLSKQELSLLDTKEIMKYIFHPGFSTAGNITDVSGRGVGMDVVKTNIEKLGGRIEIHSSYGAGTAIKLILPLTLVIISALIVEMEELIFAIPQIYVQESVLIQPGDNWPIEFAFGFPILRLRGQLLPIVWLNDVMNDRQGFSRATVSEEAQAYFANRNNSFRILVINSGNAHYALAVDRIHSHGDILVKPITYGMKDSGYYSGITVLGDGRIAMILMLERIAEKMNFPDNSKIKMLRDRENNVSHGSEEEQHLLLFRVFGEELLGLELSMVKRIETLSADQVKTIGKNNYVIIDGQTIRVIHPYRYLPLTKGKPDSHKLYIIIPDLLEYPVGIIAQKIVNNVQTRVTLDHAGISGPGIIGSTVIDEQIVILIDLYKLLEMAVPEYYCKPQISSPGMVKEIISPEKDNYQIKILLLEDTIFFAKIIIGYLNSVGYIVSHVENGQQGYNYLLENQVDLVVSDIEMPVMDGLEFVRKVRSNEKLRYLPVLALTSLTGDAHKERGLRAGFDVYEGKLDKIRLLKSIADLLKTTQSRMNQSY